VRQPGTFVALATAALVSWTCTPQPAVVADDSEARRAPATGGGEDTDGDSSERTLVEEAAETGPPDDPEPRQIDTTVYTDDGVPGLRIPIHDPTGHAMGSLWEALDRARRGEGKARLTFYGASHVASDWFTGHIREELQTRLGDAGHGFILPVHPWRTYRHLDVVVESSRRQWDTHRITTGHLEVDHYGLAGVAVESDTAGAWGSVRTAPRGPTGTHAGLYDLYYLKQPGGGELDVVIDGRRERRISTAADEREPGFATFEVEDGPHRFMVRVVGNGPVRIFGVAIERDRPGVVVDTLGINGARARLHLLWEDALYRAHLERRDPDLVVLAYGTNEAGDADVPIETYEERVREVVGRVREVVPDASCLLVGPSDRPERDRSSGEVWDRPRTMEIVEVQKRVSEDLGCGFFDLVAFMGGPMSMVDWVEEGYGAPDHVHYTRDGYERLGEALLEAMLRGYGDLPEPGDAEAIAESGEGSSRM